MSLRVSGSTIRSIQVNKDRYLDTAYATDKGIQVGSPAGKVIEQYGKDYERLDSTDTSCKYHLHYQKLGIHFAVGNDEKVTMITISAPLK
ncbi:MAG: hypothetical protein RDV48_00245 [Candidatus Eremiobacteraeota bacterium]|nr:hypothetical protein [Candidatus Eremiobacteraeota bacterium]